MLYSLDACPFLSFLLIKPTLRRAVPTPLPCPILPCAALRPPLDQPLQSFVSCLQLQIAIGCIVGFGMLLVILLFYCWKKNRK